MIHFKLILGLLLLGLCFSCKTKDPPLTVLPEVKQTDPGSQLLFERVEAENVEQLTLYFVLEVQNPRSASADLDIQDWHIQINDQPSNEGAVLILDSESPRVAAGSSARFPLRLGLDMNKFQLSEEEAFTVYLTELQMHLRFAFDTGDTIVTQISTEAVFPRIREPEFSISSIAVKNEGKGEQSSDPNFRVSLHIDNPNVFPLELSSLSYSFYGDGKFWADGQQNTLLHIPANSSTETYVFLMINFIDINDINKNLQNHIAALKQVQYRLMGETTILTNIVYLPEFRMDFDLSGNSDM